MQREPSEVLSAFVDGEPVDPEVLSEALSGPGAVTALVDFIRLRGAAREDRVVPSPQFYAAFDRLFNQRSEEPKARLRSIGLAFAATVLIGFGVAAGWIIHSGNGPRRASRPPEVTREENFVQGVDWHSRS